MARRVKPRITEDVWFEGLRRMFEYLEISATRDQQEKLFFYIIATIGKFIRDNSDKVLDVGLFSFEKTCFSEFSLFRVKLNEKRRDVLTAEHAYKYYTEGLYEMDKLKDIVEKFIENMLDYSAEKEKEYDEKINKLKVLGKQKKNKT